MRLAEVWLDDFKQIYYDRINNNLGDFGNITSRLQLRQKLQCKRYEFRVTNKQTYLSYVTCHVSSFQWYLDTVYPEQFVPTRAEHQGSVRSAVEGRCLTAPRGKKKDMVHKPALAQHCKQYRNPAWNQQYWHFSGQGE